MALGDQFILPVLVLVLLAGLAAFGLWLMLRGPRQKQKAQDDSHKAWIVAWESLREGMTEKDVNQLLGKPRQVVTRITDSEWRYSPASWSATVTFRAGRVIGFKEPLP